MLVRALVRPLTETPALPVVPTDEMVTNGTFAADSGWTKGTGWTIAGGKATHAPGSASVISQAALRPFLAGATYTTVFTGLDRTVGSLRIRFQGGTQVLGTNRTTNATFTENLVAAVGNDTIAMVVDATSDYSCDNVSVRRVA